MSKPGSAGSLRAAVLPFGQLVFSSLEPFNVSSVLDVWLKGSVVSNAHLAFESSSARRSSEPVSLVSLTSGASEADVETASVARALGPDDDGWWRVLVNLPALLVGSGEGGDAVLSDLLGPSPSSKGVEGVGWDRMVFLDASGGGFEVAMEDAWLRPILGAAPPGIENCTEDCDGILAQGDLSAASVEQTMVPLYGAGDLSASSVGPTDLVARLAPNTTASELAALCAELESAAPDTRFNGACRVEKTDIQAASVSPDTLVEWPFLALTAASPADLKAMRSVLVGRVDYFDIDGDVYALGVQKSDNEKKEGVGDIVFSRRMLQDADNAGVVVVLDVNNGQGQEEKDDMLHQISSTVMDAMYSALEALESAWQSGKNMATDLVGKKKHKRESRQQQQGQIETSDTEEINAASVDNSTDLNLFFEPVLPPASETESDDILFAILNGLNNTFDEYQESLESLSPAPESETLDGALSLATPGQKQEDDKATAKSCSSLPWK